MKAKLRVNNLKTSAHQFHCVSFKGNTMYSGTVQNMDIFYALFTKLRKEVLHGDESLPVRLSVHNLI